MECRGGFTVGVVTAAVWPVKRRECILYMYSVAFGMYMNIVFYMVLLLLLFCLFVTVYLFSG